MTYLTRYFFHISFSWYESDFTTTNIFCFYFSKKKKMLYIFKHDTCIHTIFLIFVSENNLKF